MLAYLRAAVVLGLLWVPVVHSDVECNGTSGLLTSGLALSTFASATTVTVTTWLQSTGSTFGGDQCWEEAMAVTTHTEDLVLGRTDTTGGACVLAQDGTLRQLRSPMSAGWHHLAGRLSGGVLTLFVDGVSVATSTGMGPLENMSGLLQLCGAVDGFSPDRLAEVQVFDVGLSDAAIERLALSRLRGQAHTTPTGYWPLQDCPDGAAGTDVTFRDRSGNARDLTGNSGVTCRAANFLSQPFAIQ